MDNCNPAGLTQKEIQLLKKANEELSKNPDGMKEVFLEYFRRYPHNQKYFSFRNVALEDLPDDVDFKKQCVLVTAYMTACIENLEDYELVECILFNLGKTHRKFKIPVASFWESRNVIVEGISKMVDAETYTAYEKYWDFVVNSTLKAITC